MIRIPRLALGLTLALMMVLWCSSTVGAQALKIGYIKDDRIYQEWDAWTKAPRNGVRETEANPL